MSVLGRFTLVSCLSVFVLALALSFVTSHLLTQYMLGWEWQHTAELVRYQVLAYSLERRFADSGLNKDRRLFKESLSSLLALPEVVRVKVWDKAGTVLWSDDESQIGRRFPDDDELQEALSGKTTIELGEVKQQNTDDRQEFRKLAEMYVPIPAERDPRRIAGVLEIYKSPMRPFGRIRTVRLVLWATSAAVASVPGAASV